MNDVFYIYSHRRNDTGEIFYVGKGGYNSERPQYYRAHSRSGRRNEDWNRIASESGYSVEIVCDGLDEALAYLLEIELIASIGRSPIGPLVNKTSGGGGAPDVDDPIRIRRSVVHLGNKHALGYKFSEEQIVRRSEATRGKRKSSSWRQKRIGKAYSGTSSRFYGVSWDKRRGLWSAYFKKPGDKRVFLGRFSSEEVAAAAVDNETLRVRGVGARLNFPANSNQSGSAWH